MKHQLQLIHEVTLPSTPASITEVESLIDVACTELAISEDSYGNILIDRINNLIKEGMQKRAAIINGASDRFRPVLMTAATTVFALLPTAIGIGDTGSANVPLAIAVIGGTVTATLLTLYIIPMFYLMIAKTQHNEN